VSRVGEGGRLNILEFEFAADNEKVTEKRRLCPRFATILVALVCVREKPPRQALDLRLEMARDCPENPLRGQEAVRSGRPSPETGLSKESCART
jgi:hypothetical protein